MSARTVLSLTIWILSLASFGLWSSLKCVFLRLWGERDSAEPEPEPFEEEMDDEALARLGRSLQGFDVLAGGSLILAGAGGFWFLNGLANAIAAFTGTVVLNAVMGLSLHALGQGICQREGALSPVLKRMARNTAVLSYSLGRLYAFFARKLALYPQGQAPSIEPLEWELLLSQEEGRRIVEGVIDLEETIVREIMVPRIDIVAVEAGISVSEATKVVLGSGHSRIPAYEGSLDNIVGVLYAKDLLKSVSEGATESPIRPMLRPPYFVPETKRASELLREMQRDKVHLAVVVDEYGGTAGIVTIEDILEEIVGEIQDEYDVEEPLLEYVSEDEYIVDSRLSLDDLEDLLGMEFDLEGVDTVGGLVYSYLGRVPEKGALIPLGDYELEVLSVLGRRIGKVRIRKMPPGAPSGQN